MIDISGCNEDRSDEPSAGGAPYRYPSEGEDLHGAHFFAAMVKATTGFHDQPFTNIEDSRSCEPPDLLSGYGSSEYELREVSGAVGSSWSLTTARASAYGEF